MNVGLAVVVSLVVVLLTPFWIIAGLAYYRWAKRAIVDLWRDL